MAISSISGAAYQIQLQQTQRAAEQARQNARALQTQASEAQAEASRAEENARTLKIKAGQAQNLADQTSQNLGSIYTISQLQPILGNAYTRIANAMESTPNTVQPMTTVSQTPTLGSQIDVTA